MVGCAESPPIPATDAPPSTIDATEDVIAVDAHRSDGPTASDVATDAPPPLGRDVSPDLSSGDAPDATSDAGDDAPDVAIDVTPADALDDAPVVTPDVASTDAPDVASTDAPDVASTDAPDVASTDVVDAGGACAPGETVCGGACVDTQGDESNCGACGASCAPARATGLCMSGLCGVARCNPGFADCDRNPANGCEVESTTDARNCGACGTTCPTGNVCAAGACVATCTSPRVLCGSGMTSACRDLQTDANHCGACGRTCSAANAVSACVAGACTIDRCNTRRANCDGNAANGCETDIGSSVANCGACGRACPAVTNGMTGCFIGVCVTSCNPGYVRSSTGCVLNAAPRPIAPTSLGDTTLRRPTLTWVLPTGVDGAVVELCRNRACTSIIETLRVRGTSARPSVDLPARSVIFWRLRAIRGTAEDTNASATWLFHTPAVNASSGIDTSFNPHVDVNGDGFDDVVVGASNATRGDRVATGEVRVFHGSATGVATTAARVLEGEAPRDYFGASVSGAGDTDGDGFGDLVVGAYLADSPSGVLGVGTASVYLGGPDGLSARPARVTRGLRESDFLGISVSDAGDVDRDGYADVVAGIPNFEPLTISPPFMNPGGGSVRVLYGHGPGEAARETNLSPTEFSGSLGQSVAGVGDVNGDGYADVAAGGPNYDYLRPGTVNVYLGGPAGLAETRAIVLRGALATDLFGFFSHGAGDVNGDGYTELLVGAWEASPGGRRRAGTVGLYLGSAMGTRTTPARVFEGANAEDRLLPLGCARDLNGDGFAELAVGSWLASPGGRTQAGVIQIYRGSSTGPSTTPVSLLEGVNAGDQLGASASGVDVNGDGYADLAIGARSASPGGRGGAGVVFVVLGGATGLSTTPARTLEGTVSGDSFGIWIAGNFRAPRVTPASALFAATALVPSAGGSLLDAFTWPSSAPRACAVCPRAAVARPVPIRGGASRRARSDA